MFKVSNSGVIWEYAKSMYCRDKKKNILMIIAVFLTSLLISTVLFVGEGYYQSLCMRNRYMEGMDYDISLTEPTEEQVSMVKSMSQVKCAGVCVRCTIITGYEGQEIDKVRVFWIDSTCYEKQLAPALAELHGSYPKEQNEIMLSEKALKEMGISHPKVGMSLPMSYYNISADQEGESVLHNNFILSGYYKDYTGKKTGYISKDFFDKTGVKQTDFTQGTLNITLKNPLYSQSDILKMIQKLGLSHSQVITGDDDAITEFIRMMIGLCCFLLMVFLSGFLFIYNIQYLSLQKDIRAFGQLKTIGTTSKQLRKIVNIQTFLNAMAGITLGMIVTLVFGNTILKLCLSNVSISMHAISWNLGMLLALGIAVIFSFTVVFLGSRKSRRMVENISPMEAMKYIGVERSKKGKKRKRSGDISSIAMQNVGRDKKQLFVILSSLSVAIALFLIVNSIILSNRADYILNQVLSSDMELLNTSLLSDSERQVFDADFVSKIRDIEGVKDVREVTSIEANVPYQKAYEEYYKELYKSRYTPGDYDADMARYKEQPDDVQFTCRVIGVDDLEFKMLNATVGNVIDEQAFKEGKICFAHKLFTEGDNHIPGNEVTFSLSVNGEKVDQSIEIGALIDDNPAYYAAGYSPDLIVSKSYLDQISGGEALVEKLKIDYNDAYDVATEMEIKEMIQDTKNVSIESKLSRLEEMKPDENRIRILGNVIAFTIAILAIMNFVNMMCTSLEHRSNEFAILESIGMTRSQQRKMVMIEALFYAVFSIIIACAVGIPLSYLAFQNFKVYDISFSVPVLSDALVFVLFIGICIVITQIVFAHIRKVSIIELLRENV